MAKEQPLQNVAPAEAQPKTPGAQTSNGQSLMSRYGPELLGGALGLAGGATIGGLFGGTKGALIGGGVGALGGGTLGAKAIRGIGVPSEEERLKELVVRQQNFIKNMDVNSPELKKVHDAIIKETLAMKESGWNSSGHLTSAFIGASMLGPIKASTAAIKVLTGNAATAAAPKGYVPGAMKMLAKVGAKGMAVSANTVAKVALKTGLPAKHLYWLAGKAPLKWAVLAGKAGAGAMAITTTTTAVAAAATAVGGWNIGTYAGRKFGFDKMPQRDVDLMNINYRITDSKGNVVARNVKELNKLRAAGKIDPNEKFHLGDSQKTHDEMMAKQPWYIQMGWWLHKNLGGVWLPGESGSWSSY